MKKHIESMIPEAMTQIEQVFLEQNEDGTLVSYDVDKVYQGYIASMGASLIQSGLLPTLAIFSSEDSADEGDRWKLMRILTNLVTIHWANRYESVPSHDAMPGDTRLLTLAARKHREQDHLFLRQLRRDLTEASVALKLALRTFKLV